MGSARSGSRPNKLGVNKMRKDSLIKQVVKEEAGRESLIKKAVIKEAKKKRFIK